MKYKRLSNRRFYALKYNIVLQGFIFSSNGFLVCCSITILFACKVLSLAMFKGFKGVVCVQVQCVCVIIARLVGVVVSVVLLQGCCGVVDNLQFNNCVVDRLRDWGNERTSTRALPNAKLSFYNGILADAPIPAIHITVYLILVFQIIQQAKKIG